MQIGPDGKPVMSNGANNTQDNNATTAPAQAPAPAPTGPQNELMQENGEEQGGGMFDIF